METVWVAQRSAGDWCITSASTAKDGHRYCLMQNHSVAIIDSI